MNTTKPRLTAVVFLGIITVIIASHGLWRVGAADSVTQSPTDLATKLIGTWKLETAANPGIPSGIGSRLKLFTGTHWCVIQPNPDTGVIVFLHGGRYVLEGDQLKETTDFAGELTKGGIGSTGTFTIQVEGDTYKQVDPNRIFNETWKRVK